MSDVNIPLLRKVVEWAEGEAAKPELESEWDQGVWASLPTQRALIHRERALDGNYQELNYCGTAYCIAGKVCQLAGDVFDFEGDALMARYVTTEDGRHLSVGVRAMELLGLDPDDPRSSLLFDASNSIEDVREYAEDIAGEPL